MAEWWLVAATVAVCALIAGIKVWLKSSIEKSVSHNFDVRIEAIKADYRTREELLKNSLRAKETDLTLLRNTVLDGRSERMAWLEKRRLEALDRIWGAVIALGKFKMIAGTMAVLKFDAAAKEAHDNPAMRQMMATITSTAPKDIPKEASVDSERPFVSPVLWAHFAAYRAIYLGAIVRAKVLEIGVKSPAKYLNMEHVTGLILAVLPHQKEFLDKYASGAEYYLLEEIETKILKILKQEIDGVEQDQSTLQQAREIMKAVNDVTASQSVVG